METSEEAVVVMQARRGGEMERSTGVKPYLENRMDSSWHGRVRGERNIRNDAQFSLRSNRMSVGTIH